MKARMAERLLIVDDNMMMRHMLMTQLNALGCTDISKAVNGSDAMNQLNEAHEKGNPFHIVLLDWNMPEMNGLDFLKKCRGEKHFSKTAIVMITAESEQQNIFKALDSGATSFLTKPYNLEALEEKMKQVREWLRKLAPGK